jgi:hypothetical protein
VPLPYRHIYARISISDAAIRASVERDRALTRRMVLARFTPAQARRAWRRIRSHRLALLLHTEMQSVIADIQRAKSFWRNIL